MWLFDFPARQNRGSDDDDDEEEEGEVDDDDDEVVKEDKNKITDGSEGKASDIEEETVKKTLETSEVLGMITSLVIDGNSTLFYVCILSLTSGRPAVPGRKRIYSPQ